MEGFIMLIMIVFIVEAVLGSNSVSVMEGDFVTLKSDVSMQERDQMLWYFNDTLIALIRDDPSEGCVYDGERQRFRNRLSVDFETGSLTITNIRSEHAGRYEAEIVRNESSETSQSHSECDRTKIITKMINTGDTVKTFSVSVRPDSFSDRSDISASRSRLDKFNKGSYYKEKEQVCKKSSVLSVVLVAGVCAVAVVLVAVAVLGVFYYRDETSKKEDREKNKSEHLLTVSA
ncbi:uncharacterized protein LOC113089565 [Carassius auratus]|uniref:Uncharacterized protein LOC113089565 n=1 Tax=Carassius auratus TaxID=7957 RepID=A0A6P6NTA9_CARAU|nr:uncharacterized protein LOC113089565 [Carassius auratus]